MSERCIITERRLAGSESSVKLKARKHIWRILLRGDAMGGEVGGGGGGPPHKNINLEEP